jgi:hypothetical protein
MVSQACNARFLEIVFDLAEIFDEICSIRFIASERTYNLCRLLNSDF